MAASDAAAAAALDDFFLSFGLANGAAGASSESDDWGGNVDA
jgi:hypothetical protein